MKIIITGANGYIGSNLIKKLSRNNEIFAVSRYKVDNVQNYCKPSNIFTNETFKLLKSFKPTHVIHTQGLAHKGIFYNFKNKKKYELINEVFTEKLFRLSSKLKIKRFIYLSSLAVHVNEGYSKKVINETSKLIGKSLYAKSKINCEKKIIMLSQFTKTSFIILRPAVVYGKNAPGNASKLFNLTNSLQYYPLKGIKNRRSMLSIFNLISALEECLVNQKALNKTFLIADKETISTVNLLKIMIKSKNKSIKLFKISQFLIRIFESFPFIGKIIRMTTKDLIVDSSFIRNELNWKQPLTQRSALKNTFK